MTAAIHAWALPRLQQLLPLDEDSLKQIITYADTLPKDDAAEHLKNLLGDSAHALEFIAGFNLRRQRAPDQTPSRLPGNTSQTAAVGGTTTAAMGGAAADAAPPPGTRKNQAPEQRKKKKGRNIHSLPARQLQGHGDTSGAYRKCDEEDYMPKQARQQRHNEQVAENLALREARPPDATQLPLVTDDAALTNRSITAKAPPSAAGPLVSDLMAPSSRILEAGSASSSRSSSRAPKAKVNISGGTAMHGASTALTDLDAAIRALEVQTNPTLAGSAADDARRKCNCMGARHALLDMAPNCLECGHIVCVKQGLGPCTFCGTPLLAPAELAKVLRVLRDERGEERMRVNNSTHRKAEVATGKTRAFTGREFLAQTSSSGRPSPLSSTPASDAEASGGDGEEDPSKAKATAHRDRLLGFQANNARRTRIHDEAADYDVPAGGTSMWASPQERAQQLKRQQRALREIEWATRPEHEKRRVVASIDLAGGKVVRRMAEVERPDLGAAADGEEQDRDQGEGGEVSVPPTSAGRGAFGNNPLLGTLVRPRARVEKGKAAEREKRNTWRRVQMDGDEDNEKWILDGGAYGGKVEGRVLGAEEPACG